MESILGDRAIGIHPAEQAFVRAGGDLQGRLDRDDKIIVGLVVDIDDIISFHGDSVGECQANFRAVIDDCIAACQQTGAAPEKPASGKLMLRVAPTVHAAALKAAARSGVSLNKWAEKALSTASKKASGVRGSRAVGG